MFDDYDSINDAPFIHGQFGFLGGTTDTDGGVVWFTFFDSLGSFVSSTGWILSPGLFIYSFDHTGLAAADAGVVQVFPSAGVYYPQYATMGTWLANATPPEIGTENLAFGDLAPDNAHLFTMEAVQLGACCTLLTGACTYGPSTACGGEFHPEWDTCDPNPCPPATCGDGDLDPGEECDDGNTVPGDGCDALCREEATFIPAVSEWGLLAMTLIGLTVGTVLFGRRRAMA
jgi:cysteine-rich repeat protein